MEIDSEKSIKIHQTCDLLNPGAAEVLQTNLVTALQPRSHSAEESDGCSAMELGRNRVIRRNHVVTASELVDGAGLGDEPEC